MEPPPIDTATARPGPGQPPAGAPAGHLDACDLSVVVLSWNTKDLTRACLAALRRDEAATTREIIVVDNASEDGTADMVVREFPEARVQRNGANLLYSRGNNIGVEMARGRIVCLLNSDTEVLPGALDTLVRFLDEHRDYGAVAPQLVYPDLKVQPSCRRFPLIVDPLLESTWLGKVPPGTWLMRRSAMASFDHRSSRDVDQPAGACFAMRRRDYLELGGLDEELALFFNDVDLCRRIKRRGWRIRYLSDARVVHHLGASTQRLSRSLCLWMQQRTAYYRKYYGRLAVPYLRLVVSLWALRVWLGIRFGPRAGQDKKAAVAELRRFLRECR